VAVNGKTAIQVAQSKGLTEIVTMLERAIDSRHKGEQDAPDRPLNAAAVR